MTHRSGPDQRGEDLRGSGYRKPPASTRFSKGQSGNPRGRPKRRHRDAPYEAVLGQKVIIREDGIERQVTAAEAFLLQLTKRGLEGDGAAARAAMRAIEASMAMRPSNKFVNLVCWDGAVPGSVICALEPLRMARVLNCFHATARVLLEPWLVEAALAHLGNRLTAAEQRIVIKVTRTPHKVNWPDWWTETGEVTEFADLTPGKADRLPALLGRRSKARGPSAS